MSNAETIVIIGAGQAGLQAAASLRQAGFEGGLHLIGEEPYLPYQRPPLSKAYLLGELEASRLELKPGAFYEANDISLHLGVGVTALDMSSRQVKLTDGAEIGFGKVVFATGAQARPLTIPGADFPGVHSLRTIQDIDEIRPDLLSGKRLIVIGGGYIGLEVAAVARSLGLEVNVFEAAQRVLMRSVGPLVSDYFSKLHERHGVDVKCSMSVERIERQGDVLTLATSVGIFDTDLIVAGIGAQPNVELAVQAGLEIDNGIVVDEFCRTSHKDIYAVGDCATFESKKYGRRVRLESVQNAIDQAKAVARSLLDKPMAYDPVPWFWSDQYDVKLQIAGLSDGYDVELLRGDPETGSFSVLYLKKGKFIGIASINYPRDHMMARRLLVSDVSVDLTRAKDLNFPLKEVVLSPPD